MRPDAASELVQAYLRVNGYFVATDMEVHVTEGGHYRSLTDVDVLAVRHPTLSGPKHYRGQSGAAECLLADEVDPMLGVARDRCDVIIGEVKRGEVGLNPGLRDPRVLHAVVRRTGDVFGSPVDDLVDSLAATGIAVTRRAQVRLVAFGSHGSLARASTVHHDHAVGWLNNMLARHRDLFEITAFSDPVLSLLALAGRVGRPLAPVSGTSTEAGGG